MVQVASICAQGHRNIDDLCKHHHIWQQRLLGQKMMMPWQVPFYNESPAIKCIMLLVQIFICDTIQKDHKSLVRFDRYNFCFTCPLMDITHLIQMCKCITYYTCTATSTSLDQYTGATLNAISWSSESKWLNDLEGHSQWPPFFISPNSIQKCMFDADFVIVGQICGELLCQKNKVYGQAHR